MDEGTVLGSRRARRGGGAGRERVAGDRHSRPSIEDFRCGWGALDQPRAGQDGGRKNWAGGAGEHLQPQGTGLAAGFRGRSDEAAMEFGVGRPSFTAEARFYRRAVRGRVATS